MAGSWLRLVSQACRWPPLALSSQCGERQELAIKWCLGGPTLLSSSSLTSSWKPHLCMWVHERLRFHCVNFGRDTIQYMAMWAYNLKYLRGKLVSGFYCLAQALPLKSMHMVVLTPILTYVTPCDCWMLSLFTWCFWWSCQLLEGQSWAKGSSHFNDVPCR